MRRRAYRDTPKSGAGATGTIDPTEYFYSGTTGLLTKVTYTAGGSTYDAEYEYDGNARLVNLLDWIDDVDGLEYAYDAAGRLTQLTDYDGTTLDYAYDAAGRVTSMNDYFSPCRLGLIGGFADPGGTPSAGRPNDNTSEDGLSVRGQTSQRGNRGQTRLTRGLVRLRQSPISGQVSTITAPGSKTWTYAYNALGQPTSVSIPNGMTTEYGYDTRNRFTAIEHKDGATVLDGFTYALDTGGNITRTTQADSSLWDYEYDGRDRLTKAERYDTDGTTLLHRYSYTYDAGDNLLTKLVYDGTNTVTTSYTVNDANEMTSMSVDGATTTFAYDALGRTTSKADGTYTASYAYGSPGMLSTVTSDFPDDDDVTYVTGGNGKRRSRTVDGTETWYNWAGFSVINEENSAGVLTRTYFGHTAAHVDGTTPATGDYEYYLRDNLGSARHVRKQDKSSFAEFEYDPYGGSYASSGSTSSISRRYAMLEWDAASAVYFAPYRYYASQRGRWLTRDPLGIVARLNLYSYSGTPVSVVDPLGLYDYDWMEFDGDTLDYSHCHIRDEVLYLSPLLVDMFPENYATLEVTHYGATSGSRRYERAPSGHYIGTYLRTRTKKGMVDRDRFGWSLNIDPPPGIDNGREDLRIHPDGPPVGTEGCIGVTYPSVGLYNSLRNYLHDHDSISLYIEYPDESLLYEQLLASPQLW